VNELFSALNAFQAELVTVGKTAANPFYKSSYADLASIMKAAQPVLTKHGLSVTQLPTHINRQPALRTIVAHSSGQSVEDVAPIILIKNDPQSQGSAITYMRRYAYAAALGIVIDEDDDGNRASRVDDGYDGTRTQRHKGAPPGDDPWATSESFADSAAMQRQGDYRGGQPDAKATKRQLGMIGALFSEKNIHDHAQRLVLVNGWIDTPVADGTQLTRAQASAVIDRIKQLPDEVPLGDWQE
jgi:hypothetical protein